MIWQAIHIYPHIVNHLTKYYINEYSEVCETTLKQHKFLYLGIVSPSLASLASPGAKGWWQRWCRRLGCASETRCEAAPAAWAGGKPLGCRGSPKPPSPAELESFLYIINHYNTFSILINLYGIFLFYPYRII